MINESVSGCLALCQKARSVNGASQLEVLDVLMRSLQALSDELSSTAVPAQLDARRVIEQMQAPVITMDVAGYVTGWNGGAQRLFGYTADEVMGKNILFLNADDPVNGNSCITDMFPQCDGTAVEVRRRKKSGEVVRSDLIGVVMAWDPWLVWLI